jgi:hypothetical protein
VIPWVRGASDTQDTEMSRAPEIFGRILNLQIVAFQTGLIKFLSKAGVAKARPVHSGL